VLNRLGNGEGKLKSKQTKTNGKEKAKEGGNNVRGEKEDPSKTIVYGMF